MRRRMMKSKIHRATVTDANLNYVGSITLDPILMAEADILEYEQVAVVDIDNGARLETYVCSLISAFGEDDRVLAWDLYNEPGGVAAPSGRLAEPTT